MPSVPFIRLDPLVRAISEPVLRRWEQALSRCEFVEGPLVRELEHVLCTQLGVPHAVACSNGSDALILALQTLGVKPGMKVALPDTTFWATYEAVVQVGAIPVLVDIDPDDLQMSFPEFVRAHEHFRFEAAILVHLFGWASSRLADFRRLCAERDIRLVEDAAQAYGVRAFGEPVVARASAATLSFYPAKVIGGAMDGGAVTCAREEDATLVRRLKNHGRTSHYAYSEVGWNSRMAGLQAAYLLEVTARTDEILANRRRAFEGYREAFRGHGDRVRTYGPPEGIEGNGYLAVFACRDWTGDEALARLEERGIGGARTYPQPLHAQPPAKDALLAGSLTHSTAFCMRNVNLPLFYGITDDEWQRSARALLDLLD